MSIIIGEGMQVSTPPLQYFREERFRTPLQIERKIGLWVDRIGSGTGQLTNRKLRILGQYAAVYVEHGYGEYIGASGEKKSLGPGDVVLCFPELASTYFSTRHWKTYWVVWNGTFAHHLEKAGYVRSTNPILRDGVGNVKEAYQLLLTLMAKEDLASVLERKIVLLHMVHGLFRYNNQQCPQISSCEQIKRAIEFLTQNYVSSLSVDELAEMFTMSPTNFRRMFKKYSGKTPKELIKTLRISKAKELLSHGHAVKTVAAEVGYEDVFYFMKIFKHSTSMTAGQFRRLQY
jgi:AraC-like DNA-binding protein